MDRSSRITTSTEANTDRPRRPSGRRGQPPARRTGKPSRDSRSTTGLARSPCSSIHAEDSAASKRSVPPHPQERFNAASRSSACWRARNSGPATVTVLPRRPARSSWTRTSCCSGLRTAACSQTHGTREHRLQAAPDGPPLPGPLDQASLALTRSAPGTPGATKPSAPPRSARARSTGSVRGTGSDRRLPNPRAFERN